MNRIFAFLSKFIYNDKFLDKHIDIWRTQLLFWVNVSIQYGHENGFSPVCVRICLRIISPDRIIFGQNGQAYCCPASLMGSACNKWIRNIWWNFHAKKISYLWIYIENVLSIVFLMMFFNMSFTISFLTKWSITIWTTKRFFSSMCSNMHFHMKPSLPNSGANWTSPYSCG